jgi:hypothetical protein
LPGSIAGKSARKRRSESVKPVLSTFLGAESRPAFLHVDRKPDHPAVGSMRPEDWPRSEFER